MHLEPILEHFTFCRFQGLNTDLWNFRLTSVLGFVPNFRGKSWSPPAPPSPQEQRALWEVMYWGVAEPGLESGFLASYPASPASFSFRSVFGLMEWQGVIAYNAPIELVSS